MEKKGSICESAERQPMHCARTLVSSTGMHAAENRGRRRGAYQPICSSNMARTSRCVFTWDRTDVRFDEQGTGWGQKRLCKFKWVRRRPGWHRCTTTATTHARAHAGCPLPRCPQWSRCTVHRTCLSTSVSDQIVEFETLPATSWTRARVLDARETTTTRTEPATKTGRHRHRRE